CLLLILILSSCGKESVSQKTPKVEGPVATGQDSLPVDVEAEAEEEEGECAVCKSDSIIRPSNLAALKRPYDREAALVAIENLYILHDIFIENGVPQKALERAIAFFENDYRKKDRHFIRRYDYMAIIDFERPALEKRLFILNLNDGTVASYYVAHGRGSDPKRTGRVVSFSNIVNSLATSKGHFITGARYH